MDTKHLYYALQVAEYHSISKAAEALFLSQPTLSGHINKLETELGCKIFDRNTLPLKLTYEGELFMDYAIKILNLEKELTHQMQSSKKAESGRITLGIPSCYSAYILPQVLPLFKERFPNITIDLVEESSTALEALLEKQLIDLAIVNLPIDNKNLLYETLLIDHVILAIPNKLLGVKETPTHYPLSPQGILDSISLKDYEKSPFLLLKPGHRVASISKKILEEEQINPPVYIYSRSIDTLCEFCMLGHGITFVSQTIAYKKFSQNTSHSVSLFDLAGHNTDYSMVALYHKKYPLTPSMKYFIQTVREVHLSSGL